jgi:hypothetical protein
MSFDFVGVLDSKFLFLRSVFSESLWPLHHFLKFQLNQDTDQPLLLEMSS